MAEGSNPQWVPTAAGGMILQQGQGTVLAGITGTGALVRTGTQYMRGIMVASPNTATGTIGAIFPSGPSSTAAAGGIGAAIRRSYIEEGTWSLGVVSFRLVQEVLGVGDTFTVGVAKNGVSLGTVVFADGDAVGLERTVDLSAESVTVDDYLTITYTQSNAAAQDNRVSWTVPMKRTA